MIQFIISAINPRKLSSVLGIEPKVMNNNFNYSKKHKITKKAR